MSPEVHPICSVQNCRVVDSKARLRQTGTTDPGPKCGTTEERFWRRVDRRDDDACWPWLGAIQQIGYGYINHERKQWQVHRFAWCLINGWIGVVRHNYREHRSGRFATVEEAADWVREARLRLHTNNLLDRGAA